MSILIAEIGPGYLPVYTLSKRVALQLRNGASYLGIDTESKELEIVRLENRNQVIVGDLRKLPLRDNCVDEMWLMNIFSGFVNKPERRQDGALVWTIGETCRYFDELTRVTNQGGSIHIGEYYPPKGLGSLYWMTESDYTQFGLEKDVYTGDRIREFLEQHGMRDIPLYKDVTPFFITLKKK